MREELRNRFIEMCVTEMWARGVILAIAVKAADSTRRRAEA